MWSIGRSDRESEDALPLPLEVRAIRTARRMRLRIDERKGVLKLTCPPRTSRRTAVRWALEQSAWIEAQLAKAPALEPFVAGAEIPLEGESIRLVRDESGPRNGRLVDQHLIVGGDSGGFGRRVELFLRRRARDRLSADVEDFSRIVGVTATSVSIGDAASRWGSCSSQGRIRFNWRLILAPAHVRRFVAAHEVAHLRHLNHGPDFRQLESMLVGPGLAKAKADLRALSPRLRRLGRGG